MRDPKHEAQLAEGFRQGDPEALRQVVEVFSGDLYRLLYQYTRNEELAEDLCQEVFLRAFRKRALLRRTDYFRAWLFTLARNLAAKEMRRHRHHLEFYLEDFTVSPADQMEAPGGAAAMARIQDAETRALLIEALNHLEPDQREIIMLRFFADLPVKEVAGAMDLPMGTVGGKLRRALDSLRAALEERGLKWNDLEPME